jgi:hypothetical protein
VHVTRETKGPRLGDSKNFSGESGGGGSFSWREGNSNRKSMAPASSSRAGATVYYGNEAANERGITCTVAMGGGEARRGRSESGCGDPKS